MHSTRLLNVCKIALNHKENKHIQIQVQRESHVLCHGNNVAVKRFFSSFSFFLHNEIFLMKLIRIQKMEDTKDIHTTEGIFSPFEITDGIIYLFVFILQVRNNSFGIA